MNTGANEPTDIHPATWSTRSPKGELKQLLASRAAVQGTSDVTKEVIHSPVHEWVAAIGKIALIYAIFAPYVIIAASAPQKTARISTYALLVGSLGSIVFMLSLGLRVKEFSSMSRARKTLYVIEWIVFCMMIVASIVIISIKYAYALPLIRSWCRKHPSDHECGPCSIVGFFY
jgi:hypothetical protein